MTNLERLAINNENLQECIDKAKALPDAGSGGDVDKQQLIDFFECNTTELNIPNGVTKPGNLVEYCWNYITKITIPDSVVEIGDWAFASFSGLEEVVIPNSVIRIGEGAFAYCGNVTNVKLGDSVVEIGPYSFASNYAIKRITIPNSVEQIGAEAFDSCPSLTEVDFTVCTHVPIIESSTAFETDSPDLKILVPAALYDEWISATNWSELIAYIVPNAETIKFYIKDKEYECLSGMTWGEFCESEYNNGDLFITESNTVGRGDPHGMYNDVKHATGYVLPFDIIIANCSYTLGPLNIG